jgi:hypothetical protein
LTFIFFKMVKTTNQCTTFTNGIVDLPLNSMVDRSIVFCNVYQGVNEIDSSYIEIVKTTNQ